GNGSPRSSYGCCSTTAGAPYGQRTATRRNARGGRPSCRSMIARSSIGGHSTGAGLVVAGAPGGNAPDDEELLARLHEAEAPGLADEVGARSALRNAGLQLVLLHFEPRDLGLAAVEHGFRVLVAPDRLPVEDADEHERAEGEQASRPNHGTN